MDKPKRRTKATRVFWESHDRMINSRISVETDSAYETVSIECPGEEPIFMQGDDARAFIDECKTLYKRFPSLPMDVCESAIAEPYTVLWS